MQFIRPQNSPRLLAIASLAIALLASPSLINAQVPAFQRAGFNLPIGQVPAPNTPAGAVVIGENLYTGDAAGGFRHWRPADPNNSDPINSGLLVYDTTLGMSLGGNGLCLPFCQAGQVAYDGVQTVYVAAYDHLKGNGATTPGVWRLTIDLLTGQIINGALLVPNAGLAGNNPTAIALGPDGNVYVGFQKNDNVVRIVHPELTPGDPRQVVQSVGKSPNGNAIRSLAFVGSDLYVAHAQGLAVIKSAVSLACQGGCGATPIADGFTGVAHVGITSDGINRLYLAVNGQIWRYTLSTSSMQLISVGGSDPNTGVALTFAFVNGHSNLVQLDRQGNLWIGDDISDGNANFSGRIWYISAASLASIP